MMLRPFRCLTMEWLPRLACALWILAATPRDEVAAQDGWSLERRPARRRGSRRATPRPHRRRAVTHADRTEALLGRYERLLRRNPYEDFTFRRWVTLHRERDGDLRKLETRLRSAATASPPDRVAAILLARLLAQQERWEEARRALARAARLPPGRDAGLLLLEAAAARATGDQGAERSVLEEALRTNPPAVRANEVRRRLLRLAVDRRDLDAARDLHRALRRGAQGDPGIEGLLAATLLEAGREREADEAFEEAWKRLQGAMAARRRLLLAYARQLVAHNRPQRAIGLLRERMPPKGLSASMRLERLDVLVAAHRRADRVEALTRELAGLPPGAPERSRLGELYEEIGALEEAERTWQQALRRHPRSVELLDRLAALLGRLGRAKERLALLERGLRLRPTERRRLLVYLDALQRTEGTEAAERAAMTWSHRRARRDPALLVALAERLARWGATSSARTLVERAARLAPTDVDTWSVLGSQRMADGDLEGALQAWRRVREGPGERIERLVRYARLLSEHGLAKRAEAAWREVLQLRPDHLDALRALAEHLEGSKHGPRGRRLSLGSREEAARLWQRILEHPQAPTGLRRVARRRLVELLRDTGRLDAAQARWRRAIEAAEPNLEAGRLLVEALLARQPPAVREARSVLETLVRRHPEDPGLLRALARMQEAEGTMRDAIETLRRLAELEPARAARHLLRAAEHARHVYLDALALRLTQEATRRAPDDAGTWRRLGELYLARQQPDRAAAALRRALVLDGRLHRVAMQLARIEMVRHRPRRAATLLGGVLRESPDDDLLRTAGEIASHLANVDASAADIVERAMLARLREDPSRSTLRLALLRTLSTHLEGLERREGPERRTRPEGLARRMLSPLLAALHAEDPTGRLLALDLLARLAPPEAIGPLLAFAADPTPRRPLRLEAVRTAVRAAHPEHAVRFVRFAQQSEDAGLAAVALAAVARTCSVPALDRLARMRSEVRRPPHLPFAAWVVHAACGNDASLAAAHTALARPPFGHAPHLALLTLALHAPAEDSHAMARAALHSAPDLAAVAQLGAACLVRRHPNIRGTPPGERLLQASARRLFAPSPRLREAARRLWAALTDRAPAEPDACTGVPFADWLLNQPVRRIPQLAARLLSERLPPAPRVPASLPLAPLEDALRAAIEASSSSRRHALRWLLDWTAGRGAPPVPPGRPLPTRLLHDITPTLRRAAEKGPPEDRDAALRLLARLPNREAEEPLLAALREGPSRLRRSVLESLVGQTVSDERLGRVLADTALQDEHWVVRRLSVLALASWPDPRAVRTLARVLQEEPFRIVRAAACDALGRHTRSPAVVRALHHAAARDPAPTVRRRCRAILTDPTARAIP